MEDWHDLAALASARADVYRVLATAFLSPPDRRLVAALQSDAVCAYLTPQKQTNALPIDMPADALEALTAEYYRLFIVPGPSYVRPFESVYMDVPTGLWDADGYGELLSNSRGRQGLLWGPSTLVVQQAYARAGFALTEHVGLPPDHIGLELDFMACLCGREGAAWYRRDRHEASHWLQSEKDFLADHPLRWIGLLAERLAASDVSPFYPTAAKMATAFVQADQATITDLCQATR